MLIRLQNEHPNELRADFQQFYNLNIDGMGTAYSYSHAACLAAYLPVESRCARADSPELEWSNADYMLASVEYVTRLILWSNTKDAQRKRNQPKPLQTPADKARIIRHADTSKKNEVDKAFDM